MQIIFSDFDNLALNLAKFGNWPMLNKKNKKFWFFFEINKSKLYYYCRITKFENVNNLSIHKKYYLLGLYINELLYKTIKEGYDFEKIYDFYKSFLVQLTTSSSSSRRLAMLFEKNLLDNLGYGLHMAIDSNISEKMSYIYDFNEGFKIVEKQFNKSIIHGVALKDFL